MQEVVVMAGVELCRECLELRGPCFDRWSRRKRRQRCACQPEQSLWKAYDYNKAIELCRCCAVTTIDGGSRWSPFFCDRCKEGVLAYNRVRGGAAIPIGRHSIINEISLTSDDEASSAAREGFSLAFAGMGERIARTYRWHHERVRAAVRRIAGDSPAVSLDAYLDCAAALGETADAALAGLARRRHGVLLWELRGTERGRQRLWREWLRRGRWSTAAPTLRVEYSAKTGR